MRTRPVANTDVVVSVGVDPQALGDLYSDPYISRVGHDHRPAAPIVSPAVTYLTASVNGEFAGAFMVIRCSAVDVHVHALLKRNAVVYSRELGRVFLDWVFETIPVLRATALVIEGLESARNFCVKVGMKPEGFMRDACVQNGVTKGVHVLGMTRQDWREL